MRKEAIRTSFEKKKEYVTKKLEDSSGRTLYSVVNELIDNKKEKILPNRITDTELADRFLIYFQEKIEKIRKKFTTTNSTTCLPNPELLQMSEFEPATLEEITDIAKSFGVKCSPEDPVPASLIDIDTFAPYWMKIVNLSLELEVGVMESLKLGVLIPLIKDLCPTVDCENLKNYRPVTNLLFVSKLSERVVQTRLERQMIRDLYGIYGIYIYGIIYYYLGQIFYLLVSCVSEWYRQDWNVR